MWPFKPKPPVIFQGYVDYWAYSGGMRQRYYQHIYCVGKDATDCERKRDKYLKSVGADYINISGWYQVPADHVIL